MNNLIEVLEENCTLSEIVELINDFDRDQYENYMIGKNTCPRCGGKLLVHRWKEDRREYFGFPCSEDMEELWCEDCNETY